MVRNSKAGIYKFFSVSENRGTLVAGEFPSGLPFTPKRFFLISDVPHDEVRGKHAHFECYQFLVAVKGSVIVKLRRGTVEEEFELCSSDYGLLIPPMTWGEQSKYSDGSVLLVFASHIYDEGDYITDFNEFLRQSKDLDSGRAGSQD